MTDSHKVEAGKRFPLQPLTGHPSPLDTSHCLNAMHSVQKDSLVLMALEFPPVLLTLLENTCETMNLYFRSFSFHPLGGMEWLCLLNPWRQ